MDQLLSEIDGNDILSLGGKSNDIWSLSGKIIFYKIFVLLIKIKYNNKFVSYSLYKNQEKYFTDRLAKII